MKIDLKGKWTLKICGKEYPATIPGCNYLDLIDSGAIQDPFYKLNEKACEWVGLNDCLYRKHFTLNEDILNATHIDLVMTGIDTLSSVKLNGEEIASTDNAFRTYRIYIKKYLKIGDNTLEILLLSPVNYVKQINKKDPLVKNFMGLTGIQHLRKPSYHFGWDWGPNLPLSGISGDIYINAYDAKIEDVKIEQVHRDNKVELKTHIKLIGNADEVVEEIITPDNETIALGNKQFMSECVFQNTIDSPLLWYPNGLGDQPLYTVKYKLLAKGNVVDEKIYKIGLRTIELDNTKDKYGSNFCFIINGRKLFIKGANWIPSDSFIHRTKYEDLEFYIKSARNSNFNMLRIWGGGYYESEDFYVLCDRYGILVWQDFCYACYPYPFYNEEFKNNALIEAEDNIKRLRHHASLALWCGNNEIETMSPLWSYRKKLFKAQKEFFYNSLKEAVQKHDEQTPYWAGSPTSGEYCKCTGSDDYGDTHLWQVWHGLRRPEYYRGRLSRFISEFGMEALPTMNAVKKYISKNNNINLNTPETRAHQKCAGGNSKMLYYLLMSYNLPEKFDELVYLSGLTQAYAIKKAVLGWRKAYERVNGALYWQFNDCWPVSSWASIDYTKSYKALNYFAKHFYSPTAIYLEREKEVINIYGLNDNETFFGYVKQRVLDFEGKELLCKNQDVTLTANASTHISQITLDKKHKTYKRSAYLLVELYDKNGVCIASERELFVKEKDARYIPPKFDIDIKALDNKAQITVKSDVFARNVLVDIEGLPSQFNDNYLDIDAKREKTFVCVLPQEWTIEKLKQKIKIYSVNSIKTSSINKFSFFIKLAIALYPPNFIHAIAQKFN